MNAFRLHRFPTVFIALATAIVAVEAWICLRVLPSFADPDLLAGAVLADLLLLIPALYYLLEVRRNGRDLKTLVPVTVVCMWLSLQLLPSAYTAPLKAAVWLLPAIELGLVLAVVVTVARSLRGAAGAASGDLFDTIHGSAERFLGPSRAASILAFEMGVFAYALGLRRKAEPQLGPQDFSYHRKTAFGAYTGVLLLVVAAEIVPVHLLLERWSPLAAWIVFGLSVYSAVWMIGDARAVPRRPIRVEEDRLRLRLGIRWSLDVPWQTIERLEAARGAAQAQKDDLSLVPLGAGPNVELTFKTPVTAEGPYGIQKTIHRALFYVDELDAFQAACERHLQASGRTAAGERVDGSAETS